MTDETDIAAFVLSKDVRVSLTFDGNIVHVEAEAENGQRAADSLTGEEAATDRTLSVRIAMLEDRLNGDQHGQAP